MMNFDLDVMTPEHSDVEYSVGEETSDVVGQEIKVKSFHTAWLVYGGLVGFLL